MHILPSYEAIDNVHCKYKDRSRDIWMSCHRQFNSVEGLAHNLRTVSTHTRTENYHVNRCFVTTM